MGVPFPLTVLAALAGLGHLVVKLRSVGTPWLPLTFWATLLAAYCIVMTWWIFLGLVG